MGHKVNPIGLRLGINRTWESRWFANRDYAKLLHEDLKLRLFLRPLGDDDPEVGEPLLDAGSATATARLEAAHDDRAADLGARHHQPIDIELMVVLGIRDRALQRLAHVMRDALLAEGELCHRQRGRLVADHSRNQVQLARAHADIADHGLGLGLAQLTRMFRLAHRISPASPSCRPSGR